MNAKELIELLSHLSPDTTVLIPAMESSFNSISKFEEVLIHPNLAKGTNRTSIIPYCGEFLEAEQDSYNYDYTNEELQKAVVLI